MTTLAKDQTGTWDYDKVPEAAVTMPLAYGYMRVPADAPDSKVLGTERAMRIYAAKLGYYLIEIFYEFHCGSQETFNELVHELQRADAHAVVVPSYRHFARSVLLQNNFVAKLEFDAQAKVFELRGADV
ncbi:hypothetical protein SAMN04489729_5509 [Amycolatopsis lurida]|uniref:Resolvase/invertase-type recombinase catalytic domain-containing protein n=1 Tax=Amycolatopsis lurida NRRL 2430 TaxID=1460371 RepID=A0A2P2FVK9_AMYLU|nr:recombinase family protein [Amycolatopsis lurida]KFU80767.1 hypothetical protein BB31_12510 [Amycolatopsis lurida NRRL 2430]SED85705.1 hypothetical protein SAMN04489729_5509 [Amycolatopsis lurida]